MLALRFMLATVLLMAWGSSLGDDEATLPADELSHVREVGELAGWARFCAFEWQSLHDALMAAAVRWGRTERQRARIDEIFRESLDAAAHELTVNFCPMAQVRIDVMIEEELKRLRQ